EGATGGEGGVMVEKKQQGIDQVMSAVRTILDPGRGEKATFVSSANAIVITAIPATVTSIKEMLSKVDRRPPQILLEAKIIEIILDDDEQLGIDWNLIISAAGARRPVTFPFTNTGLLSFLPGEQAGFFPSYTADQSIARFPSVYDAAQGMDVRAASVANSIFSYGTLDCSQLAATLRMIDDTRDTNILSTPRITTLNNQRATIKVVQKVMLQKTQEAIQTANVITVEFEKDADAREIGVKLTVIPHVNETGDIVVNLIPEVSSDLAFEEREVSGAQNTVAMTYNTREANTRVRVQDGETIFIGGLIRDQVVKRVDKFPLLGDLLGDIPYLGKAFKYEAENVDKTEIVFFVTVHLVKDGMDSIDKSNTMDMFGAYHTDYYGYKQWEQEKKEAEPEEKGSGPEKEGHAVKTEKPGEKEKGPEAAERPRLKKGGTSIKKARSLISLPPDRENKKEENEPWLDFR
ncbi:MAG: type II secretion system protein GspD, partial [Candidatus Omnitrophica bacterium]|nr:type II secretion system protein GspD [Candidatus Omnitrophota bacterium]